MASFSRTPQSAKTLPPTPPMLEQHLELKAGSFFSSCPDTVQNDLSYIGIEENRLGLHLGHAIHEIPPLVVYNTDACVYSPQFPPGHCLNTAFAQKYQLEDELGSGGYGFVMTAYHRIEGDEVAVKFIIKDKVPEHAWTEDPISGRIPTEVLILTHISHPNIVKCLAVFEDDRFYYLVQELHGSPWHKDHKLDAQPPCYYFASHSSSSMPTPSLSPSSSHSSLPASEPNTPPHVFASLHPENEHDRPHVSNGAAIPKLLHSQLAIIQDSSRPEFTRRPSHDLFECIEQSEHKKLNEAQARFVFSQVVDAVQYLHDHNIVHRDIKDENLVIDKNLKVKLIDFGSAVAFDPVKPRPFYQTFCGTAAYASSEILLKKEYQAAPAEIWTLGILLSYLLAGVSPFPTARDAADGRIFLSEKVVGKIPDKAMDLMRRCLDPNPTSRADISEIKAHAWLRPPSFV
ncbi:PAS domain-containing serine/threonine-protein kinase [Psilocybe cubensis]|uniref:Protein kinase domain-containing protein n=2 Tax=Psilocybe cubensis TaxID=181762 RepID=A0A8H7Y8G2_PSICU|nr:PAS domain-containing serine/threonine-protein kinase [Psilocybe cubensis]KAH9485408.1 PAS domain-containing serine/threonine-protein kinase [Psilocybe cubensis]